MHQLPYEMIMHIIGFVPDKVNVSMTCKLFCKLCNDLYDICDTIKFNDPYDINKFYNRKNILMNREDLKNIDNHNSLNCMFYKLYFKNGKYNRNMYDDDELLNDKLQNTEDYMEQIAIRAKFVYRLLYSCCNTNNILKPIYINKLTNDIHPHYYKPVNMGDEKENLLNVAFKNKSYDIAMFLLLDTKIKGYWSNSLITRYKNETNINIIINEINMIVDHHVMTLLDIYENIYSIAKDMLLLYDDLLKYLQNSIKPTIFNMYLAKKLKW